MVAELPCYEIVKDKCTVQREHLPQLFGRLQQRWPEAGNVVDGLRLDWADRWVHVRPSNTEPIVRTYRRRSARAEWARELIAEVRGILASH